MRFPTRWGRRLAVVGLTAGALVTVVGSTGASARPRLHTFTAHAKLAILDSKSSGGSISGGPFGRTGAAFLTYKANGSKLTGTGYEYGPAGRMSGPYSVTISGPANGPTTFVGTGQVTGGTGRFRGAHGTTKINGTAPPGTGSIGTFTIKYSVTY
jgi:hypothetical protein